MLLMTETYAMFIGPYLFDLGKETDRLMALFDLKKRGIIGDLGHAYIKPAEKTVWRKLGDKFPFDFKIKDIVEEMTPPDGSYRVIRARILDKERFEECVPDICSSHNMEYRLYEALILLSTPEPLGEGPPPPDIRRKRHRF